MTDIDKVIKGQEMCGLNYCDNCPYDDEKMCSETLRLDTIRLLEKYRALKQNIADEISDTILFLKKQQSVLHCNECKYYEGVHDAIGHAPCLFWGAGGVAWNEYCSKAVKWDEEEKAQETSQRS